MGKTDEDRLREEMRDAARASVLDEARKWARNPERHDGDARQRLYRFDGLTEAIFRMLGSEEWFGVARTAPAIPAGLTRDELHALRVEVNRRLDTPASQLRCIGPGDVETFERACICRTCGKRAVAREGDACRSMSVSSLGGLVQCVGVLTTGGL